MATFLAPPSKTPVHPKRKHSQKLQKQTALNSKAPKPLKGGRSAQRIFGLPIALLILAIVAAIYFTRQPAFPQPKTFQELLSLTPAQINQCDVGLINLLCAEGLVGSENLDVETALNYLDKAASEIRTATQQAMFRYYEKPSFYQNYSVNQFRVMVMADYVQKKLRWIYNPDLAWLPDLKTKKLLLEKMRVSSQNIFIHGLLFDPHMGTCSSIPSLWIALGARLGYPLYTVQANSHNFTRWDDEKERFNFEVVDGGVCFPPDERYLEWPFPLTQQDLATGHYLKNQTPAENCAYFLGCRMGFLWRSGGGQGIEECVLKIHELAPNDSEFMKTVLAAQHLLASAAPRALNSPRTAVRLPEYISNKMTPGSSNPLHSENTQAFDQKEEQLQALRDGGADEESIAMIAQNIPDFDSDPDPVLQQIPSQRASLDPMGEILKTYPSQIRGKMKAAIEGEVSLVDKSAPNNQVFSDFPIGQYPIDETWRRYED